MNINQHFSNLAAKAAEEGTNTSQLITQRDRLFKDKVIPELVKRRANDIAIVQARSKWNKQTDTVMSNAGLLPKAGQSSQSFAKDKRAEKAIKESVKTGSQLPIIKESARSFGDTVGNLFGQGSGAMLEGAAGFVRDIGENEQDSIAAKATNYGKNIKKGYENSASTFQKELQAGQHGKSAQLSAGAIQSMPAMAAPFGAAKGVATVAGKIPALKGAAAYLGIGAGLAAGHTQNYGEVRRNSTANLERDFPTFEKLQGNPLYEQNFKKHLDSGVGINQARKQAHAETLDAFSEDAADTYGSAMTAIDFIAPSGTVLGSGILKNAPTSKVGKALVGGGVSSDLVRREMTQSPRVGMAKLIPDVSVVANKAAAKMVGKQALEEGLQGSIGEYGAQAASANIGGKEVDWGKVGQSFLEEAAIGGIMGGGMQSGLGGSPTSQAKTIAKQLRNQTNALRQEEAAARQELAKAIQFNNPEQIQSAQANLQNIGAEANKVKAAYDQHGMETPYFVSRFANQYKPTETQEQPQEQQPTPEAQPAPVDETQSQVQPNPAPQPSQPTQVDSRMANTTNLVMDSVTKGLISPEEAQAIQTNPLKGDVFSLIHAGDEAAAHNIVMNAVSAGSINPDEAQNLIESIPRYSQLIKPQKPSLSGIVNDHVKQQIQPQTPSQDGGLFSNAVDLDPNTLEPIDQNQPSPFQDDFNQPKQFMNPTRANDYVRNNGLSDSHELIRHDDGVIEVRPRQDSIPADPNLNDFGHNPAQNMQPIAEDQNLTDFSDGAVSVASVADIVPEILEPQIVDKPTPQPTKGKKQDFSKPKIFSNHIKAKQYVKENHLEDTHEIIPLEGGRAQVQLKSAAAEPTSTIEPETVVPNQELEAPASDSTFADQIRDAHLNNPKTKPQLINDEVAKGRPRPEVLKEVADVVKSVNDSKPKEPEQKAKEEQVPSETVERIAMPKQVSLGLGQLKTTPIDKPVYREMNLDGFEDLVRDTLLSSGNTKNLFVTDNIDLALGQGDNKGILVQFRGDAISGKEHKKPIPSELTGREYKTDFISIDSIDQFILPKDTKLRSSTRRGIQGKFTYKKLDDGSILATRNGFTGQPLNEMRLDETKPTKDQKTDENGIQENDAPDSMKSGDIGRGSDGKPFLSRNAALRGLKLRDVKDTHEIIEIAPSQFVLREKAKLEDDSAKLHSDEEVPTPVQPNEHPFQKYDELAKQYGRSIKPDGTIVKFNGQDTAFKIQEKKGRLRIEDALGNLTFSGAPNPESLGKFLEDYWYDKKLKPENNPNTEEPAPEPITDSLEFPLDKVADAYGHAHLSPRNTARSFKESFDKFIQSEIDEAKPLATTEAQQTALDQAIHWIKDSYINKALPPLLSAASATVSSARAGRNNFNAKQADKRGSALDKATTQFDAELERLKGYAQLKVLAARTPEQKQADADAEAKAQEEKAAAEQAKIEVKLKIEEEAKANKKRASNKHLESPDGAVQMTAAEWRSKHKDSKSVIDGVRYVMKLVDGATSLVPVWISDEKTTAPKVEKTVEPEQPTQPAEEPQASDYEVSKKQFDAITDRLDDGNESLTIDEVKQAYKALMDNHEGLVAELSAQTKQQLLDRMHPYYASMYKSYKKDELVNKWVSNTFRAMDFASGGVIQISYGDNRTMPEIVRDKIEAATQEDLNKYLEEQRKAKVERAKAEEEAKAGMNDPKTMDDFKRINANGDFSDFKAFYRSLTLPQQALYDELKSNSNNESRMQEIERNKAHREASNPSHAVESTTDATLYAGKHTKKDTDIWTVALNGRVDGDAFNQYRSQAKNLGGYYSRYTGGGAVAGFIFDNEAKANEFLNLVTGDSEVNSTDPEPEAVAVDPEAEIEVVETDAQRRAEKLREKAQVVIDRGEKNINRDRKANTAKRAGEAARAEEQANKAIFLGETLNRIADGIENGSVKYLSRLGAMTQLGDLESLLQRASYDQQRETNAKEREITANTITYTEFPQYRTFVDSFRYVRDDLKAANPRLAAKLESNIENRYRRAYSDWLNQTNEYGTENYIAQTARKTDGSIAIFKTNIKSAETLVKTLNKKIGKDDFEVFKIKNGEYAVISSYQAAMTNESWKPTRADQQLTLKNEFGHEIYDALKQHQRKNSSYRLNWHIESMHDAVSRIEKLGIHDPATFRAAMREYLGLRSKEKTNDPVKELERSMIGRSNDGLDFFPTPRNVVEQMIELADMDGDMKVLEPSAGMGHIADVLKDYGIKPDVIELSGKRQELLKLKGYSVVGNDFLMFDPKNRAPNYGDVFKTADGEYQGVMRGSGSLGSNRVRLMHEDSGEMITYFDREDLELVKMNGNNYDRIIMNPPFSDRRDAAHIYHAFDLLADDGVMVAIAGEGVFFGKDKAAQEFQDWLDKVGAEITPLDAGTFNDPSLPVTTGVKARIIKISKADSKGKQFSRSEDLTQAPEHAKNIIQGSTPTQVRTELVNRFGEDIVSQLEQKDILSIIPTYTEQGVEGFAENGKVTLIADAITPENIVPVFLHELGGHVGMQGLLKQSAYDNLMADFDRLVKAGNPEALEAKRLAERETDSKIQKDEYLPYLITVATQNQTKQGAAHRLVSRVLSAIKAWAVHKLGINLKLNPSDISMLAERMIRSIAMNSGESSLNSSKYLSLNESESSPFSRAVDDVVQGNPVRGFIRLGSTPSSWILVGLPDTRVQIKAQTIQKVMAEHLNLPKGEHSHIHNLTPEVLKQLPYQLNNPIAIFKSGNQASVQGFVVLTELHEIDKQTGKEKPVIAALHIKLTEKHGEIIQIASVYGRNEQQIVNALKSDLIYWNKEKGQHFLSTRGLQLPKDLRSNADLIKANIKTNEDLVKEKPKNDTENKRFSRSSTNSPQSYSRSKQREFLDAAAQTAFGQMSLRNAERAKTLNNRTLNLFQTMLHKALKDQSGEFKKTFDLVQGKINHVTFASSKSMDVAPNVLVQLEQGSDYWKEVKRVGRTLGNTVSGGKIDKAKVDTDLDKIGKLMFENTLLDNSERHTNKELRQLGFDQDQIGLYNEVREAIDTSLDTFANTTFNNIYKHLGGTNEEVLELEGKNLEIHAHYNEILKRINALTNGKPEKAAARQAAIEAIDKVFKKANDLKEEGYVPLMRFGKYFVRIYNPTTGEVAYRQHFESESERNMFYRNYDKANLPAGYEIEQGQINELQHKLFQGVSPETVALFAKESGLPIGDAETAYIKFAVQNNHALKRLLRRQGIDGFDSDLKRVLASFVMSNARYAANQSYNPAIDESIANISDPANQEDAIRLRDYSLDTQEELAPIKNFAFVWYMGFSAMFGLVNLTQPLLQTFPYLMQYSKDHSTILKAFGKAVTTWRKGTDAMDTKYKANYERARKEGHLDPQNTWMMQGLERGKSGLGASTWQLISHASGLFAQASETVNRRTTLFAALDVAEGLGQAKLEKLGFKDAYDFAVRTIQETQGIYNKGNRPRVSRGNVGSMLMMYKQFMIAYIEQMSRMQKSGLYGGQDDEFKKKMAKLVGFGISRSVLVALGILMSFSGATGLPFVRDILDGIETAGGLIGKPVNTEREVQIALHDALGQTLGSTINTALMDGFINLNPLIDVKGRMGMGDLIPATAYFSPTTSDYMKSAELANIAGPMGGLLQKVNEATALAQVGAYGQSGVQLLPKAITSMGQGAIAATTGDYRNMKTGVKTNDATVLDGIVKAFDAQPAGIAKEGRIRGLEMKDKAAKTAVNARWKERYEEALDSGDRTGVRAIQKEVKEHNKQNPRYPVTFNQKTTETNYNKSNQKWQDKRKDAKGLEWMDEYNPYLSEQ